FHYAADFGAYFALEDAFLTAMITKRPADRERARGLALAAPGGANLQTLLGIIVLAQLNEIDDAFALAARYQVGGVTTGADTEQFFVPGMEGFFGDPRFMQLAARLKLVDYWRGSDHWPDFCTAQRPPYDCKAVAAKLTGTTP